MATHSSIIAWEIPWTEESGGLLSMGSQSRTQLNGQGVVALKGAFSERLTHTHTHTLWKVFLGSELLTCLGEGARWRWA